MDCKCDIKKFDKFPWDEIKNERHFLITIKCFGGNVFGGTLSDEFLRALEYFCAQLLF